MNYQQLPLNVQLTLISNPPSSISLVTHPNVNYTLSSSSPTDINTGQIPQLWVRRGAQINIGIFDQYNASVDLSSLEYLQIVITANPSAITPIITSTVYPPYIRSNISYNAWTQGLQAQATFVLTNVDTDITLYGQNSAEYFMYIQGYTTTGNMITYGGGNCVFYNPAYNVPAPKAAYVSRNAQSTSTNTSILVYPTSQLHTERITVTGSASPRQVVVYNTGLIAGSHVWLRFSTTDTLPIIFEVYDSSLTGNLLVTLQTDQYTLGALVDLVFNGGSFELNDTIIPAAGTYS